MVAYCVQFRVRLDNIQNTYIYIYIHIYTYIYIYIYIYILFFFQRKEDFMQCLDEYMYNCAKTIATHFDNLQLYLIHIDF